jgi:hypothetical protein
VGVAEDVPGVGGGYFGEEVVAGRGGVSVRMGGRVDRALLDQKYLLRTMRRGLLRGSWLWKRISGDWDMQLMAREEKWRR